MYSVHEEMVGGKSKEKKVGKRKNKANKRTRVVSMKAKAMRVLPR